MIPTLIRLLPLLCLMNALLLRHQRSDSSRVHIPLPKVSYPTKGIATGLPHVHAHTKSHLFECARHPQQHVLLLGRSTLAATKFDCAQALAAETHVPFIDCSLSAAEHHDVCCQTAAQHPGAIVYLGTYRNPQTQCWEQYKALPVRIVLSAVEELQVQPWLLQSVHNRVWVQTQPADASKLKLLKLTDNTVIAKRVLHSAASLCTHKVRHNDHY